MTYIFISTSVRELQGGVSTGLSHVDRVKTPKLFIVKGKRQPTIRQLPTISWSEMNDGDVFVLEAMSHIFIWVGRKANRLERLQGCKVQYITYWVEIFFRYKKTSN